MDIQTTNKYVIKFPDGTYVCDYGRKSENFDNVFVYQSLVHAEEQRMLHYHDGKIMQCCLTELIELER